MLTIHIERVCEAPVSAAFDYVADHRHTIRYLHGLSKFDAVTEFDRGPGATFDGSLKLGPIVMNSRVRYDDWEEPTLIRAKSISGLDTCFTYRFEPVADERSRVELLIEVNFHGVAGRAMSKGIAPFLDAASGRTGAQLAEQIAAYHSARRTA
jgi:hypothetical protein